MHNSKNLYFTPSSQGSPKQWGHILKILLPTYYSNGSTHSLTQHSLSTQHSPQHFIALPHCSSQPLPRKALPDPHLTEELQRAEDFTVCSQAGTQPREVSQSQDAFSHWFPPPPRGPAFPRMIPRPHLVQSPAPFLHGEDEGGQDEQSLVTGAPTLGFHLGPRTL